MPIHTSALSNNPQVNPVFGVCQMEGMKGQKRLSCLFKKFSHESHAYDVDGNSAVEKVTHGKQFT